MTAIASQPFDVLADRASEAAVLDAPAEQIGKTVRNLISGPLKDALSGTWLGHALHPLLTDVVIGSWTSATLLDLFGGEDSDRAAQRLIGIAIVCPCHGSRFDLRTGEIRQGPATAPQPVLEARTRAGRVEVRRVR